MTRTNHLGALAAAGGTLVAVGLLLLIMLVVVEARPAGATFPGKPGKIAYSGQDGANGDYEIYTIEAGGGGKFNVTDNSTGDTDPCYSPSGKQIVYSGFDGKDTEIYTINAGGGSKLQLTDNNGTDDEVPSYSPSGQKIAYEGEEGINADWEIYTINAGGGSRFNVTDNSADDYEPSWGSS